jgi:hypothetical protein
MVQTGDPALEAFRHRDDPAALEAFVQASALPPGGEGAPDEGE